MANKGSTKAPVKAGKVETPISKAAKALSKIKGEEEEKKPDEQPVTPPTEPTEPADDKPEETVLVPVIDTEDVKLKRLLNVNAKGYELEDKKIDRESHWKGVISDIETELEQAKQDQKADLKKIDDELLENRKLGRALTGDILGKNFGQVVATPVPKSKAASVAVQVQGPHVGDKVKHKVS